MSHKNYNPYVKRLIVISLFAVAMGYFEAALVVYLRGMFYPEGFSFPLKIIPERFIVIEVFREASTMVMLITVAALAAKKFWEWFGWFIILFGIWDIFYYIFLKATFDWPSSVFEWDMLFLIPIPWIGPVIAPVLVAVLMTATGISITLLFHRGYDFKPTLLSWILSLAATASILFSFVRDTDAGFRQHIPEPYRYELLITGLILYSAAYLHSHVKVKKSHLL